MKHIQDTATNWSKKIYEGKHKVDGPSLSFAFGLIAELAMYCRELETRLANAEHTLTRLCPDKSNDSQER
jgi:hypothetical protein